MLGNCFEVFDVRFNDSHVDAGTESGPLSGRASVSSGQSGIDEIIITCEVMRGPEEVLRQHITIEAGPNGDGICRIEE